MYKSVLLLGCLFVSMKQKGEMSVFTDPFALSPHYYYIKDNKLSLSPSPCVFTNEIDHELNDILNAQGHLFGKYTIYKNVYRTLPVMLLLVLMVSWVFTKMVMKS